MVLSGPNDAEGCQGDYLSDWKYHNQIQKLQGFSIYHLTLYKCGDFPVASLNSFQSSVYLIFHFSCQNVSNIHLVAFWHIASVVDRRHAKKGQRRVLLITFTTIRHMKHNEVIKSSYKVYSVSPLVRRFIVGQLVLA